MTKGVLTGDTLSPLLFVLFISDMTEFMKSKQIQGIPINTNFNLIGLYYADDQVLVTNKESELQSILDSLEEYCALYKLEVNKDKTKVLVFRKKGRLRQDINFTYQGTPLEIVSQYVYLGVLFTSGLCFNENVKMFAKKTMGTISTVNSLWARTKTYNWEANMIVYSAVVKSTLLYGAEIWGLRYLEESERPQVRYLKSLLYLPRNTPNYILRQEMGMHTIAQEIVGRAVKWLATVVEMDEDRLPKMCLTRLKEIAYLQPTDTKYNWAAQLKQILVQYECSNLFETPDPKVIRDQTEALISRIEESNREEDIRRIQESSYSMMYKTLPVTENIEARSYLKLDVPLHKIRAISQVRTCAQKLVRITIHKDVHVLETELVCTLCNLAKEESLEHFMLECPIYRGLRDNYIKKYLSNEEINLQTQLQRILTITTKEKLLDVYNYLEISLKIRNNITNEYA
ncbi:hypothetical protein WDU94_005556 [Cyamophila willieti]